MLSGIYKIENLENGKVYIGQSKDIFRRLKGHFKSSSKVSNQYLHYAISKYGLENFTFQVLKETYDLDYWEKMFIMLYRSYDSKYGYNLTFGGQNGAKSYGYIYSDESKIKMSKSAKRNWSDPIYREKIIESQNEGRNTADFHNKRSLATINMWKSGKFKNQAEKISIAFKGKKKSDEQKYKMKIASIEREKKHKNDFELYLDLGGSCFNYRTFCKHYNNGINSLLEELK